MASFSSITPQQVYDRAARPPAAYDRDTNVEMLELVVSLGVLETAKGIANAKADAAASPENFPFSDAVIQRARPNATPEQREEYAGQQTALFDKYVLDAAAAGLLLSTIRQNSQTGDTDVADYDRLLASAQTALDAGVEWVTSLAADALKGGGADVPVKELTTISARLGRDYGPCESEYSASRYRRYS